MSEYIPSCGVRAASTWSNMKIISGLRSGATKLSTKVSRGYRSVFDMVPIPVPQRHLEEAEILWASVFAKEDWIKQACSCNANPVLIDPYLSSMRSHGENVRSASHHVLLLMNNRSENLTRRRKLFFESLRRGYVYDQTTKTVVLPACRLRAKGANLKVPRIILYISDVLTDDAELPTDILRQLFKENKMQTEYTFALDRHTHTLNSCSIRGLCGPLRDDSKHIPTCTVRLLEGSQFTLRESYCPPMELPIPSSYCNDSIA